MKNLILSFLCLLPLLSISQKLTQKAEKPVDKNNYYVVPFEKDTVFGKNLTHTGLKARLDVNDETLKWDKKNLEDYGRILKSKKRLSTYHSTAFPFPTFRGFTLKGINSDTTNCYVKQWTGIKPKSLTVYYPNHAQSIITTENTQAFCINKYNKDVWYDGIRMTLGSIQVIENDQSVYIQCEINQFSERLSDGKIRLNKARAVNKASNRIIGFRGSGDVYLLKVGYKTTYIFIDSGLLTVNTVELLSELLDDYPALVQKINGGGYTYKEIPAIIDVYNTHFEDKK